MLRCAAESGMAHSYRSARPFGSTGVAEIPGRGFLADLPAGELGFLGKTGGKA